MRTDEGGDDDADEGEIGGDVAGLEEARDGGHEAGDGDDGPREPVLQ